jgi:hypothetical protein
MRGEHPRPKVAGVRRWPPHVLDEQEAFYLGRELIVPAH